MLLDTATLVPGRALPPDANLQVYCGLDCCITLEVYEAMRGTYAAQEAKWGPIYRFERALQAPYLSIMQRGFRVDLVARANAATELERRIVALSEMLTEFAMAIWDKPLNPRSSPQLQDFFFRAMNLPEVWLSQKGVRKPSVNREALEKLETYMAARPIVALILQIRDLSKQLEVFQTEIDTDGRFRAAYNIAGTETGRPSSSKNAFGTGRNAQNISPGLRHVFQADPGFKMAVIDLEQTEARDVGYFIGCLFNDWSYLDACETGDVHTVNAQRIWPDRAWSDDPKENRRLADQNFYRDFTYRDMAKRGSHLSNYMGTAFTASRSLKVPLKLMEDFQSRYCRGPTAAYPGIPRWWQWVAERLQTTHELTTPFGRRRHFFGRPGDDTTLREAIAFLPQSTTADRMNLGLWRIWAKMPEVELLAQTHDSVTFQYPDKGEDFENDIITRALNHIAVRLSRPDGRDFIVPGEAKIGWNWGNAITASDLDRARREGKNPPRLNPSGLIKWRPKAPDRRGAPVQTTFLKQFAGQAIAFGK